MSTTKTTTETEPPGTARQDGPVQLTLCKENKSKEETATALYSFLADKILLTISLAFETTPDTPRDTRLAIGFFFSAIYILKKYILFLS
jgi:hypothetical protein